MPLVPYHSEMFHISRAWRETLVSKRNFTRPVWWLFNFYLKIRTLYNKITVRYENGDCVSTVVKVLCYKSEGRWFDSRWCHWNFLLT